MICSPTNAYPNNNCVDGSNYEMKITFNGDYCMGADFYVYNYQTKELCNSVYYYERGTSTDGFRNGEEIDIVNTKAIPQNQQYVWRAKFYEPIDVANGYYPTVYSSKGFVQKAPLVKTTVTTTDVTITSNKFIPVAKNLDIEVPCYVYWQEHGRRLVVNYHREKGILKLSEAFNDTAPVGTDLYLSNVKINSVDGLITETGLIPIEKGLNIDVGTHRKSVSDSTMIPNTYIKINNNYYGITKYYYKTGYLGVDSNVIVDEGTPYQIYQCFIISPYYYFTTKATPTITPTMTFVNEVIKCEASIGIAGYYPVKYFYWSIYDSNGKLVNRSERIWSGRLEYLFREVQTDTTFTGKITIVTQDGVEVTSDSATCTIANGGVGITDLKATLDSGNNTVKLTWKNATDIKPTSYIIQRIDEDGNQQYLETLQKESATSYTDYSCGNNLKYKYIVIPVTVTTVYQQATVDITTNFDDWEIYFLTEVPYERPSKSITDVRIYYNYMYGDKQFKVTSAWKVQMNPKIDDITHNILRDKHDTYRGKPAITYGDMNYDSFPVSFILGNVSCPDYNIVGGDYRTFQKWKDDINSKQPILLKDSMGHVWFGSIMNHTFVPDYNGGNYNLYTIKFDFEQTRDMYADNQTRTRIMTN